MKQKYIVNCEIVEKDEFEERLENAIQNYVENHQDELEINELEIDDAVSWYFWEAHQQLNLGEEIEIDTYDKIKCNDFAFKIEEDDE